MHSVALFIVGNGALPLHIPIIPAWMSRLNCKLVLSLYISVYVYMYMFIQNIIIPGSKHPNRINAWDFSFPLPFFYASLSRFIQRHKTGLNVLHVVETVYIESSIKRFASMDSSKVNAMFGAALCRVIFICSLVDYRPIGIGICFCVPYKRFELLYLFYILVVFTRI